MTLVDPEAAIAVLHELRERDLALIAVVAVMCDSEREAIERLDNIASLGRDHAKALPRRSQRDRERAHNFDRMAEIASRLSHIIAQVEAAGSRRRA